MDSPKLYTALTTTDFPTSREHKGKAHFQLLPITTKYRLYYRGSREIDSSYQAIALARGVTQRVLTFPWQQTHNIGELNSMSYRYNLLFAILCLILLLPGAKAQNAFPQEAARISYVMSAGDFEGAIAQTTEIMNRTGMADATLLYLRGYAKWHICWFGDALTDLKPLGDFHPNAGFPVASELVQEIEQMKALAPTNVEEIKEGGQVLFRVYYDEDTDWTKAIRKLLPQAFKIGSQMYGVKIYETAVFIFKEAERFQKFRTLRFKNKIGSWSWATGSEGMLLFCRTDAKGKVRAGNTESDYFKGTIVHEYSHALLHRLISNASLPSWLDEGLAMFAETRIAPKNIEKNDQTLKRCFTENTFLSLKEMTASTIFYDMVEKEDPKRQSVPADAYSGTEGYQQCLHMVRFFLLNTTEEQRKNFVRVYNTSKNVEKSFQEVFRVSTEDFYASWREVGAKGLPAPK